MDFNALKEKYIPSADIFLYNTGRARKAWLLFGCHYIKEEKLHMFVVWAPNAIQVSVVGNFNDWNPEANPMIREDTGIWYTFMDNVHHADYYK